MFKRVLDVADVRCDAVRLKIIIGNAGFEARTPTQTHAMLVPTDDLGAQQLCESIMSEVTRRLCIGRSTLCRELEVLDYAMARDTCA